LLYNQTNLNRSRVDLPVVQRIQIFLITAICVVLFIAMCSGPRQRVVIAPPSAIDMNARGAPFDALPTVTAAPALAPANATPAPLVAVAEPVTSPVPDVPTSEPISTLPANQLSALIDDHMNGISNLGWFQGSVLVARGNDVILSKGYGYADSGKQLRNGPQTRFRIASLSKQFTAAAIMLLYARGQLNLHDSICNYYSPCPSAWQSISIHHLLTHTAGLPNYTDFPDYEATQMVATTPDELIARFRSQPLLFEPGTSYMYENSDYVLLGKIIENVSGQSYADFMRTALFQPLKMTSTDTSYAPDVAIGYQQIGIPAAPLDTSTLFAAGSINSTVEDMYRWIQALANGSVLQPAQRDALWTPYLNNYGYGWQIGEIEGHRKVSHPGMIDGYASAILYVPDANVTVIVLCNLGSADAIGVANHLATLVLTN
jgi:CubicO group peptidase (beta-lactamase class C family)